MHKLTKLEFNALCLCVKECASTFKGDAESMKIVRQAKSALEKLTPEK